MKRARIIILAIAMALVTVYLLYAVELPGYNMLWRELENAGHIFLFGVASIVLLFLSRTLLAEKIHQPIYHYGISFIVTGGFGFATEFMQWFTPRDADFWDIVRDVVGAFVFLGVFALFDKKNLPELRASFGKKALLIIAILIVFLAGMSPVIAWTGGYVYRSAQAPAVCGFESFTDRLFIRMHSADIQFVPNSCFDSTEANTTSARVVLHPAKYPEFYFMEPLPDWSAYSQFTFDIYSPADTAMQLFMRIEDIHHRGAYTDRFNHNFTVYPGLNTVVIPLDDIRQAPANREMDLTQISAFSIFAKNVQGDIVLYLDNFELKK